MASEDTVEGMAKVQVHAPSAPESTAVGTYASGNALEAWHEREEAARRAAELAADPKAAKAAAKEAKRAEKAAAKEAKKARQAATREAKRARQEAAVAPAAAEELNHAQPRKRGRRIALAGTGIVAALAAGAYGVGTYTYSHQFFPNTSFGSVDVSNMAFSEAASTIEESQKDYSLAVAGLGADFTVDPSQSGMEIDASGLVASAQESMNPWAWPVEYFQDHDLTDTAGVSIDDSALGTYVSAQIAALNETKPASEDAYIRFDEAAATFEIVPEVYGEQLDAEKVVSAVSACVLAREEECAVGEDMLIRPKVYAEDEDITAGAAAANGILGANTTFTSKLASDSVGTLDSALIGSWISFDEKNQPVLNDEALATWASNMAYPLSTVGTTRTYTRPDGKQVTISGGSFGCSTSADATVAAVRKAVDEKTQGEVELERVCAGDQAAEGSATEWGAYVDVDLTEQQARFYNAAGDIVWQSGIISGNPTEGNGTPGGIWYVNNKQPGTTLLGRMMPNGEREYETHVDYWMPFEGNLVGFHDATWQASDNFGNPEAYYSVGSHGCINLPYSAAADLYSKLSVGTAVIVHG